MQKFDLKVTTKALHVASGISFTVTFFGSFLRLCLWDGQDLKRRSNQDWGPKSNLENMIMKWTCFFVIVGSFFWGSTCSNHVSLHVHLLNESQYIKTSLDMTNLPAGRFFVQRIGRGEHSLQGCWYLECLQLSDHITSQCRGGCRWIPEAKRFLF